MSEWARELYSRVDSNRAVATALPHEAFLSAEVFDAEVASALKAGWLPVARASSIAKPGDYLCVDLLDTPLVVSRDGRAFEVGDLRRNLQ